MLKSTEITAFISLTKLLWSHVQFIVGIFLLYVNLAIVKNYPVCHEI